MEKLLAEDTLEGKDGTQFAIRLSLASLVGAPGVTIFEIVETGLEDAVEIQLLPLFGRPAERFDQCAMPIRFEQESHPALYARKYLKPYACCGMLNGNGGVTA
jgi:hypothetical protein